MQKIIVYWRDIPSQVIIKRGRVKGKAKLSHRFQEAIDRAAMRAGKGSSDAYLAEWRRETSNCTESGELQEIAEQEVVRLEALFTDDELLQMIRSHGKAPS